MFVGWSVRVINTASVQYLTARDRAAVYMALIDKSIMKAKSCRYVVRLGPCHDSCYYVDNNPPNSIDYIDYIDINKNNDDDDDLLKNTKQSKS